MFQEKLAKATADHLRSHIAEYLVEVAAQFPPDQTTTLIVPKKIDVASKVGGVVTEFENELPQYAVDCMSKSSAGSSDGLWIYEYAGHIAGMVASGSQDSCDKIVKRHSAAVEKFVQSHYYLHKLSDADLTLTEFYWHNSDFSGVEPLGEVNGRELWMAAFRLDVVWQTSEDGPGMEG